MLWSQYLKLELNRVRIILEKCNVIKKSEKSQDKVEDASKEDDENKETEESVASQVLDKMNVEGNSNKELEDEVMKLNDDEEESSQIKIEDLDFDKTFAVAKVVLQQGALKLLHVALDSNYDYSALCDFLSSAVRVAELLKYKPWSDFVNNLVQSDLVAVFAKLNVEESSKTVLRQKLSECLEFCELRWNIQLSTCDK